MAVGSFAIRTYAKKTDDLLATVDRASECLQPELWPLGPRGGGRATPHVEPSHLVNLMLAVCCAVPITSAPKVVPIYRGLVETELRTIRREIRADGVLTTEVRTTERRFGFFKPALHRFGSTLGRQLDGLVTILQQPINQAFREYLRFGGFELALTLGPVPQATVSITQRMPDDAYETVEVLSFTGQQDALPLREPLPAARPIRVVTVRFELIDVLIDLWDDTLAHRKRNAEARPGTSALQAVKPTRSRSEPHNSSDATACVCATAIAHSPHEQKGADDDDEDPCGVAEAAD
jgi:hypothetical protein